MAGHAGAEVAGDDAGVVDAEQLVEGEVVAVVQGGVHVGGGALGVDGAGRGGDAGGRGGRHGQGAKGPGGEAAPEAGGGGRGPLVRAFLWVGEAEGLGFEGLLPEGSARLLLGRLAGQAEAPGAKKSSVAKYCEAVMAPLVQLPAGGGPP